MPRATSSIPPAAAPSADASSPFSSSSRPPPSSSTDTFLSAASAPSLTHPATEESSPESTPASTSPTLTPPAPPTPPQAPSEPETASVAAPADEEPSAPLSSALDPLASPADDDTDLHSLRRNLQAKYEQGRRDLSRVVDELIEVPRRNYESFLDAAPSRGTLSRAVYNTEIPSFIARAPLLFGLFVPPPAWPNERVTIASPRSLANATALVVFLVMFAGGTGLLLLWAGLVLFPLLPLLALLWPLLALLGAVAYLRAARRSAARKAAASPAAANRRAEIDAEVRAAEEVLASVRPAAATAFNAHVSTATSIAIYGCGILAAAHVGGLRALERHGLDYAKVKTLAGVSAGAVVVAMIAVGYEAEEMYQLVASMPFNRIAYPELGAVLRACGNMVLTLLNLLRRGGSAPRALRDLAEGNGPGLNSGAELESLIGHALASRPGISPTELCRCGSGQTFKECCAKDITMGEVLQTFGKRLVILCTELDTGRERQLTPETDPNLPVRVAVRMSMGVPGLCEPFRYERHVYCDGGMCNDFPLNALPEDSHRLGLMVRPKEWVLYNLGDLSSIFGPSDAAAPSAGEHTVYEEVMRTEQRLKEKGIYPVRDALDLMMTSIQTMMDANLALQIRTAQLQARAPSDDGGGGKWSFLRGAFTMLPPWPTVVSKKNEAEVVAPSPAASQGLFSLVPHILTLSGGSFSPFDFALGKDQHYQLYLSGQLGVHLAAAQHTVALHPSDRTSGAKYPWGEAVLSEQSKLRALSYMLHLDYPPKG